MQVSYDVAARATYVELHEGKVSRTVDVSDAVMVDLDEYDNVLGVEFLMLPDEITPEIVERVVEQFAGLKALRDFDTWLQPGMPRRLLAL